MAAEDGEAGVWRKGAWVVFEGETEHTRTSYYQNGPDALVIYRWGPKDWRVTNIISSKAVMTLRTLKAAKVAYLMLASHY